MTDLAWSEEGSGPPLLWGHGLTSSREGGPIDWTDRTLPGYRVIRWDARGHGESPSATLPKQLEWPALARDALAIADAAGVDRFAIGGVSMGAATAVLVACTAPERVDALVLATPPSIWARRGVTRVAYGVGGTALGILAGADRDSSPGALGRRSTAMLAASRSDLPDPDVVAAIKIPALVLAWHFDPIHPVSAARRLHGLIEGSELIVTPRPFDITGWIDAMRRTLGSA